MCIPGMGTAMRELMAVPMQPDPVAAPVSAASAAAGASPVAAAGVEVQSGVARIAGVLWCTRHRHASGRADSVAVFVHPSSNFMGHYALADMAARGYDMACHACELQSIHAITAIYGQCVTHSCKTANKPTQ